MNNASALFVYDQPILNYEIEKQSLDDVEVLQRTLKKDHFSYSFPKGSALIKMIDPVLISTLKTMEWNRLIKEYR